jgi:hypothetical protein
VYVETDCGDEDDTPSAGIGVFSVSADKQVTFSKGNLQYTQSTNTWSFASAQWEMIGTDNVIGGSVSSDPIYGDSKEGTALADKIDLFGWSTSATNFGVSTSEDFVNDYLGSYVDWGTNQIGNDAPNTWRTLTYDEWYYLRWERPNHSELCGVAQVNGVNGLVFLPDNWTCPAGVTFKSGFKGEFGDNYYAAYQTFTATEWSKLESAGAVFLPASGERFGSNVSSVQYYGNYWSATEYDSRYAYYLYFRSDVAGMDYQIRSLGQLVRLVKDIEGDGATPDTPDTPDTPTEPEEPENTENGHEYVDLGLSVKWATCNVGANSPEEYGDYFAWGETQPKNIYDWSTYKWCNGSYDSLTKYNNSSSYGTVDNKTQLDKEDDAASVNWGGAWRMPTEEEIDELRTDCTWEVDTLNGVAGLIVTGPNGNNIFIPASGYKGNGTHLILERGGFCWSNTIYLDSPISARVVLWDSPSTKSWLQRFSGLPVRPVCE